MMTSILADSKWLKQMKKSCNSFLKTFKMRTSIDNVFFVFFEEYFFSSKLVLLIHSYSSSLVFFFVIWPESWASLVRHIGDSKLQHGPSPALIGFNKSCAHRNVWIFIMGLVSQVKDSPILRLNNGKKMEEISTFSSRSCELKGSLLNSLLPWWRMKMDSLCHP